MNDSPPKKPDAIKSPEKQSYFANNSRPKIEKVVPHKRINSHQICWRSSPHCSSGCSSPGHLSLLRCRPPSPCSIELPSKPAVSGRTKPIVREATTEFKAPIIYQDLNYGVLDSDHSMKTPNTATKSNKAKFSQQRPTVNFQVNSSVQTDPMPTPKPVYINLSPPKVP